MTSGVVLGIRLHFHKQQHSIALALHQAAANQVRGNDLRWTAEEGVGQGWETLGDGLGGYGSDSGNLHIRHRPTATLTN